MRLYEKVKTITTDDRKRLAMPRVMTIFQKCIEHEVQDCLIQRLHFNELYVLLLSLDIQNLKQILRSRRSDAMKKRNIDVRDVSQDDALKFLKGGG